MWVTKYIFFYHEHIGFSKMNTFFPSGLLGKLQSAKLQMAFFYRRTACCGADDIVAAWRPMMSLAPQCAVQR
jgi:hypothetical protein